jgi:hypothetical protein
VSTLLDPTVPAPLQRALADGGNEGFTLALLTVTEQEWPHQALISVGEIVVLDDHRIRLATWVASTTTRNMTRTGHCALTAVVDGTSYALQVDVAPRGELALPESTLTVFDGRIVESRSDTAPYAVLESGIRFRLTDPATSLVRWAATRQALRDFGPAASPAAPQRGGFAPLGPE